ncbi:hypothetical protein SKAU_G00103660 [Synaphobranchus kaupii]|uniref:Uncharacterized protein n=1 Tax=Synaphobranchus kaupii TaxID=118154 RepID=A0A9Q1J7Q0_SYNKA|nr:hypothetical protein SKAU_G00103660 [Synaphobranchus kaupii]
MEGVNLHHGSHLWRLVCKPHIMRLIAQIQVRRRFSFRQSPLVRHFAIRNNESAIERGQSTPRWPAHVARSSEMNAGRGGPTTPFPEKPNFPSCFSRGSLLPHAQAEAGPPAQRGLLKAVLMKKGPRQRAHPKADR